MKKKKITLTEDIVKYIFPGLEPAIKKTEDGYVAYNFMKQYPDKLGIFMPNEVDQSNYSAAFPKPFESYFINMHEEAEYLSRLLEVNVEPSLHNINMECVRGKASKSSEGDYTVFRFDELIDPVKKTDLLCRVSRADLAIEDKVEILSINPDYRAEILALDGSSYIYWIMPISRLFKITDEVLAAIFAFANSLRFTNGPF